MNSFNFMKMIQKVSFVFYGTESVGLNIGIAEEVGIRIYVGKAIKRPPPDRAIGPCLTELDKWQHLAPQNEQSRYEKKMILADTDNWNHIIMSRYKKT